MWTYPRQRGHPAGLCVTFYPVSGHKGGAGRRQLLAALSDHGPASRVELGRRTGLSSSAVSALTQDLIADGLVEEASPAGTDADGRAPRGRGRPAHRLALRPPAGVVVGADVGNTHVRVAVAPVGGRPQAERVAPLAGADSLSETLAVVERLVGEVTAEVGTTPARARAVTLGLPAPLAGATGAVARNNILPDWIGRRPGDELAERLGVEVAVENDANLGALGELGPGEDSLVYLKLSTGIGAGLVLGGRVFRGVGGTAGEIGHVQVDPHGALCRCGLRGCLESVVSLPRLVAALAPVTRADLTALDLAHLVEEGDPGAAQVLADAGRTVGRVLAGLVTVLNPRTLVVGGPWPAVSAALATHVDAAISTWAQPSASRQVDVRPSTLGERAEIVGALALASELVTRRERGSMASG